MKEAWKKLLSILSGRNGKDGEAKGTSFEKEAPEDPGLTDPREGTEVPWETGEQNWQKTLDARREKRRAVARKIRKGWIPLTVLLVCCLFILAVSITYLVVRDQRLPEMPAISAVQAGPEDDAIPETEPEETPKATPKIEIVYVTHEPEEEPEPEEVPVQAEPQGLDDPEEQRLLNSFLSCFVEQEAFEPGGYDENSLDYRQLVHFAYVYCRLHQTDAILGAKDRNTFYYTLPLETVNEVLERFFHRSLEENELNAAAEHDGETVDTYSFYRKGYFYFPAEDVETPERVAIVLERKDQDEGLFTLDFAVYTLQTGGTETDGGIPERIYGLDPAAAKADPGLRKTASGSMTCRTWQQDGETQFCPVVYQVEYPDALQTILDRGVLFVGTAGDYMPMSFLDPGTGGYVGFDAELAEDLARTLEVDLEFIPTSWPTLMEDTLSGRFDLAICGITITDARLEQALMSDGYLGNGKTVLCRAEDVEKYTSLAEINRPEVRVMENPGGLNEKFARENLPKATLIIHDVNQEIPGLVASGEADVMITEIMEAGYYVGQDSRLAAPLIYEPFTRGELGILMPKGSEKLLEEVNAFLKQEKENGRIDELADKYIYRYIRNGMDAAA